MIQVGIVDYKCGNIRSLFNALEYISANPFMIKEEEDFNKATHAVLPGVGAFGYCAENLEKSGLMNPLMRYISKDKPLLGICVGMQLMLDSSEELGSFKGLSLVSGKIESLKDCIDNKKTKIPHVGWNSVKFLKSNKYFSNADQYDFYFDHSYAFLGINQSSTLGYSNYGTNFTSIISKKNILACQFHPEKSQKNGLNFLKFFLENYKC